jgi:hypothetical protein
MMHVYEVRPRQDHRGVDLFLMFPYSVGCGTASRLPLAMQSDMRNFTAGHMML